MITPATDLRDTVRVRMAALGLTQATLAARMAPRWGCAADSAVKRLQRYQHGTGGKGDMAGDALAELLAELGLAVTVAP